MPINAGLVLDPSVKNRATFFFVKMREEAGVRHSSFPAAASLGLFSEHVVFPVQGSVVFFMRGYRVGRLYDILASCPASSNLSLSARGTCLLRIGVFLMKG